MTGRIPARASRAAIPIQMPCAQDGAGEKFCRAALGNPTGSLSGDFENARNLATPGAWNIKGVNDLCQ